MKGVEVNRGKGDHLLDGTTTGGLDRSWDIVSKMEADVT
jgi:hypothetical protein